MLRTSMTMAAIAIAAAPAFAAEPANSAGDAFEILGVALEVGSACKSFSGFEYHYLSEAWGLRLEKSAAQEAYGAVRKAALDAGADALNAGLAGEAVLKRHAASYREKAVTLGCAGGEEHLDLGLIEAYKQLGGLIALVNGYRGDAEANSPLPPLTAEESGLVQAFHATATEVFGDNMPQFEAMIPELAQQRMARYPANPELGIARFIEEQSNAFALLNHEVLATNAGWALRGAIISDGTAFGYHTIRASKDSAPDLSLIAAPKAVTIHSNAWGKGISGIIVLGRRDDGTLIAGLAGEAISGAPTTIAVKAQSKGTIVRSVTGARIMDGCPYARCFAFTGAQLADLVPGASPEPVYFYAAADTSAPASGTGTDGQTVAADRMRALLPPR